MFKMHLVAQSLFIYIYRERERRCWEGKRNWKQENSEKNLDLRFLHRGQPVASLCFFLTKWDLLTQFSLPSDPYLSHFQIQGECQTSKAIRYKGVLGTITTLAKTEGPMKLYSGLPAGLQRQISFASLRIGLYDTVQEFFSTGKESKQQAFLGGADRDVCWAQLCCSSNVTCRVVVFLTNWQADIQY